MGDYKVVVVGTDGSESSLRAVDKAAEIAKESNAKLIVATAYQPEDNQGSEPDQLEGDKYQGEGNAPVYDKLREASDRAKAAGVKDVEERPLEGAAVDVLVDLVDEVNADLLVVGNVGLNSVAGRLLGSVPSAVQKKAKTEVLVADTKD